MNIFRKITLKTLRINKIRTIVTIIGIMLSTSMLCAVTTSVSSLQNYALQNMIYLNGDWHGSITEADQKTWRKISNSEEISHAVYDIPLGYAKIEEIKNEYKPYLYIIGAGQGFEKTMPIHILSGKYPQSSKELLLPEHLSENGGVQYKIGDTLTLSIGERRLNDILLGQETAYYLYDEDGYALPTDETFTVKGTRTYTISGFYERPTFEEYTAPGYTAVTLAENNSTALTSYGTTYDVYYKMKTPGDIYSFQETNNLYGNKNTEVLLYNGVSRYNSFYTVLYGLAAIVIVLIVFGSVSLIYNAFSISVSERTRLFGILSSVGAGKKQLRKMVVFEALAVSCIGIPLGILAGTGGIGVTLLFIGNKFAELGDFPVPMRVCISFTALLTACALALVTVLISAWIPSRRAARISAIEAIRQNTDIQAKYDRKKTPNLAYRLFGLPGVLADNYYRRSRKKYRATILSLFISIVLFISASAFTGYLTESVRGSFATSGYDLSLYCEEEELPSPADTFLETLANSKGIKKAAYAQSTLLTTEIDKESVNQETYKKLTDLGYIYETPGQDPSKISVYTMVYFINDAEFKALLQEKHLSEEIYINPENPVGIALDSVTVFDDSQQKYITASLLNSAANTFTTVQPDKTEADNDKKTKLTLKSGTTIYEAPYFVEFSTSLILLYPHSLASRVLSAAALKNYDFYFTSDDHRASYNALKKTLSENGLGTASLIDYAKSIEQERNIVTIIQVFSYGFVALISLIAAANVFNTISTNISLRRRDFAMLRSVGMTDRGFHKMMNYECLLYGTKALLYGIPVSILFTYLIYRTVSAGYSTGFRIPWGAVGIAVLSVFLVVFSTMMYAMHKIKKENLIDALKNENL